MPQSISRARSGITLIELMVVVAIISLIAAISFPAVTSGIDSLRVGQAANSIVSLLNSGLNRADRQQLLVEIIVSMAENTLTLRSADPNFIRILEMPDGVKIARVLPEIPGVEAAPVRSYVLYPGGTVPRFGIELTNRRGDRRLVRVDPITGSPIIERPQ
jgi:prepilin-type N-terminal cleavage/methylation domain-containing protein